MKMERAPYQPPQTSMEHHIKRLITMLRDERHSRSEFAQAIESAMAHAFWLEKDAAENRMERIEMERAMAVGMPSLKANWEETPPTMADNLTTYDWMLEPLHWRQRVLLRPFQASADRQTWQRIRRSTYRQITKLIRRKFEETFPAEPPMGGEKTRPCGEPHYGLAT